ncbi:hypothetical protein K502DRAFT_351472 [Neoconidiobolus thromboides FSU 785]|nr:hypothetical protein K502DRAFT_351472 [Neoconidiobolus thromboides FSU 785]
MNTSFLKFPVIKDACRSCKKKEMECDKKYPKCNLCTIRGTTCKYDIRSKRGKYKKKNKSESVNSSKDSVDNMDLIYTICNEYKVTKEMNYDRNYVAKLILKFPKKYMLENLTTSIQYPTPYKLKHQGIEFLLSLIQKFQLFLYKKKEIIITYFNFNFNEQWITLGLNSFLNYNCFCFNIFHNLSMTFNARNPILKKIVILSGLSWYINNSNSNINDSNNNLINYLKKLENEIYSHYKNLNQIKPNIVNIQALLLILTHLNHLAWVYQLRFSTILLLQRFATLLGLNKNYDTNNSSLFIERRLCYNFLSYTSAHLFITSNYTYLLPFRFKQSLYSIFSMYTDPLFLIQLLVSDYLLELSIIIYNIKLSNQHFINQKITEQNYHLKTQFYINKLNNLTKKYIMLMNHNNIKSSCYYQNFLNLLLFFYYYFKFVLYSSYFYTFTKLNFNLIKFTLLQCKLTLTYALKLPIPFYSLWLIPLISQSLFFVIRYNSIIKCNDIDLIKDKMKQQLIKDQSYYQFLEVISINLKVMDVIEAFTKSGIALAPSLLQILK